MAGEHPFTRMRVALLLEQLPASEGLAGYYDAHLPTLGLTTHGLGMEGALASARDLARLWSEEKRANGEDLIPLPEIDWAR